MPRRLRELVCGAIMATALAGSTVAQATPPTREQTPDTHVAFPAGYVCPFPLALDTVVNGVVTTTHVDPEGNLRWIGGQGRAVIRVTNEATGAFLDVNASGPGKISIDPDGTIRIEGGGPWLAAFFPTDSPSSTLLLLSGHIVLAVDPATGRLTLVSHQGTVRDLCAALA